MFRIGKLALVNFDELDETIFQHRAENEAHEKQVSQLRKTLENARQENINLQQELLKAGTTAALVPALQEQIADMDKEIQALQKNSFTPLPDVAPAKNKGGRPKKANGSGPAVEGKN